MLPSLLLLSITTYEDSLAFLEGVRIRLFANEVIALSKVEAEDWVRLRRF
jgi:hypothetical protein